MTEFAIKTKAAILKHDIGDWFSPELFCVSLSVTAHPVVSWWISVQYVPISPMSAFHRWSQLRFDIDTHNHTNSDSWGIQYTKVTIGRWIWTGGTELCNLLFWAMIQSCQVSAMVAQSVFVPVFEHHHTRFLLKMLFEQNTFLFIYYQKCTVTYFY